MPEEMQTKLTNSSLRTALPGRNYSWLASATNPNLAGAAPGTGPSSLPPPKFAPAGGAASNLPAGQFAPPGGSAARVAPISGHVGAAAPTPEEQGLSSSLTLADIIFALERERGAGAGKGTGARTLYRTHMFKRKVDPSI